MSKLLKVLVEPAANQYLPAPLKINEKVILLEDQGKFIKIRHNAGKNVSVFSKHYFGNISELDRKISLR